MFTVSFFIFTLCKYFNDMKQHVIHEKFTLTLRKNMLKGKKEEEDDEKNKESVIFNFVVCHYCCNDTSLKTLVIIACTSSSNSHERKPLDSTSLSHSLPFSVDYYEVMKALEIMTVVVASDDFSFSLHIFCCFCCFRLSLCRRCAAVDEKEMKMKKWKK